MPDTIWHDDNGIILADGGGSVLLCDECPCDAGCCSNSLPSTLTATLDGSIDCGCINGQTLTLTYNSGSDKWEGTRSFCGVETISMKFYCIADGDNCNDFRLDTEFTVGDCAGDIGPRTGTAPETGCSCDPLDVDFLVGISGTCCGGASSTDDLTVTVSE